MWLARLCSRLFSLFDNCKNIALYFALLPLVFRVGSYCRHFSQRLRLHLPKIILILRFYPLYLPQHKTNKGWTYLPERDLFYVIVRVTDNRICLCTWSFLLLSGVMTVRLSYRNEFIPVTFRVFVFVYVKLSKTLALLRVIPVRVDFGSCTRSRFSLQ